MSDLRYRPWVTVVDVLEAGACVESVVRWVEANDGRIAGPTIAHVAEPWIAKASNSDGDGDGYGYGDGDGSEDEDEE